MIRVFKESCYIVIFSALLGFVINVLHPDGFRMSVGVNNGLKNVVYLDTADADERLKDGGCVFIDARSPDEYRDSHIRDAVNIPAFSDDDSGRNIDKYLNGEKKSDCLVVYCWNSECNASEYLAERLVSAGVEGKIFIIKNGFEGWLQRGYPVDR